MNYRYKRLVVVNGVTKELIQLRAGDRFKVLPASESDKNIDFDKEYVAIADAYMRGEVATVDVSDAKHLSINHIELSLATGQFENL